MDLALQLKTELRDPSTLRLGVITPAYDAVLMPSGWGSPNTARSAISRFHVTVGYLNGPGYTWQTDAGVSGALATGMLDITAGALMASLAGSAIILNNKAVFRSGGLFVRVAAISEQSVVRYRSNYTVRLPSVLPAKAVVWVRKESEWVNITDQGMVVNGAWQWQCFDSTDQYTAWKLMVDGAELTTGTAIVQVLTSAAISRVVNTVLASVETVLFIVATERTAWQEEVARWMKAQLVKTDPVKVTGRDIRVPGADLEARMAFIGQLLDRLESANKSILAGGIPLDNETALVLLARVQAELATWKH